MRKRELIKRLLAGSVIEFCNQGFERNGHVVRDLGYFRVRHPNGDTVSIGLRQGDNITSQWCYFDNESRCYRINEPARLLLTGKTL